MWDKVKAVIAIIGLTLIGIFFTQAREKKKEVIREKLKNAKFKDKDNHEAHKKEVDQVKDADVAGKLDKLLDSVKSGDNQNF